MTVRFIIGDTDKCDEIFQDGEIEWALEEYNNTPINAAVRLIEIAIPKYARLIDETVGQVSLKYSQRAEAFRKLLNDLRTRLLIEGATPYAGGISVSDMQTVALNPDRVPPVFTKNMMTDYQLSPWIMGRGIFMLPVE